jgi:hypothetical protein
MRYTLLAVLLLPLLCFAGEKEDAAALNAVLKDVQAVLPKGWEAELWVSKYPRSTLELVVRTRKPIAVVEGGFSLPASSKLNAKATVYELPYIVCPYLTPEQFAKAKAQNEANNAKRLAFMEKELNGISWGYKGGPPYPPSAFDPTTDDQKERLRQYAILYMHTEPIRLPTHYVGTVAFELFDDPFAHIQDKAHADELRAIQQSLTGIFTPYEPPKKD